MTSMSAQVRRICMLVAVAHVPCSVFALIYIDPTPLQRRLWTGFARGGRRLPAAMVWCQGLIRLEQEQTEGTEFSKTDSSKKLPSLPYLLFQTIFRAFVTGAAKCSTLTPVSATPTPSAAFS
jgi:hypothetical protein